MSVLTATNLSFAYAPGAPILRDVSVSLDAGRVVALLGPNGSGKSTLIRCLIGQLRASGAVAWLGRDLRRWKPRELARAVAYLPQAPTVDPDDTVADVLKLGRAAYWGAFGVESPQDLAIVRDVAARLGLTDLLPRRTGELSGGQRQRVVVGRCLVQQPRALLLDEPSTYLDLRHQHDLAKLLRSLAAEGLGVLAALHDLNLAAGLADQVVLLDRGQVAAAGAPDEVLRPDLLARVYDLPMDRVARPGGGPPLIVPAR